MVAKNILELLDNKPNANQFDFLNKKGIPPTTKRVCPDSHYQREEGVKKLPDNALQSSPSQQ